MLPAGTVGFLSVIKCECVKMNRISTTMEDCGLVIEGENDGVFVPKHSLRNFKSLIEQKFDGKLFRVKLDYLDVELVDYGMRIADDKEGLFIDESTLGNILMMCDKAVV